MKRRSFGLMAGTSLIALGAGQASAQSADSADKATLLKTTLTPVGAERAGNADGSIPAWTGGYTTVPAGWTTAQEMPVFFADDPVVVTIDASNMAQYQDRLSIGLMEMMQKFGFSIQVYPTRRTASFPQFVVDNAIANLGRAQLNPNGGRLGFTGGYGAIPFPIPDTSDPYAAGAQIIWNHNCRWQGNQLNWNSSNYIVTSGRAPLLSTGNLSHLRFPYYDPNGSVENYAGFVFEYYDFIFAPATLDGFTAVGKSPTNPLVVPAESFELLQGQGRVRQAPEVQYDTPDLYSDGISQYDEQWGFNGAMDRYDWKFIGKKEMYIPYNNNKLRHVTAQEALGPHFVLPQYTRYELHRVWVVDATLHPGERNVLPHRRFYVDEDTWGIMLADCWDGNGNIYKEQIQSLLLRPEVPGLILVHSLSHNLQTGDYAVMAGAYADAPYNKPLDFLTKVSDSTFSPEMLASQSAY